jgi:hypothetical protein
MVSLYLEREHWLQMRSCHLPWELCLEAGRCKISTTRIVVI